MIFLKENSLRNAIIDESQNTSFQAIKVLQYDKSERNCGKMLYNFKKINRNKAKILIESISNLHSKSTVGLKDLQSQISNKQNKQVILQMKKRTMTNSQSPRKKVIPSFKERKSQIECKTKTNYQIQVKLNFPNKFELQSHGRANSCQALKSLKLLKSISRNKLAKKRKNSENNLEKFVHFQNILLSTTVRQQERKKGWRGRNCLTFGQEFLQTYRQKIKVTGSKAPELQTAQFFKLKPSSQKQRTQLCDKIAVNKKHKLITQSSQVQSSYAQGSRKNLHFFFSD